jgi:hypothetical protein
VPRRGPRVAQGGSPGSATPDPARLRPHSGWASVLPMSAPAAKYAPLVESGRMSWGEAEGVAVFPAAQARAAREMETVARRERPGGRGGASGAGAGAGGSAAVTIDPDGICSPRCGVALE